MNTCNGKIVIRNQILSAKQLLITWLSAEQEILRKGKKYLMVGEYRGGLGCYSRGVGVYSLLLNVRGSAEDRLAHNICYMNKTQLFRTLSELRKKEVYLSQEEVDEINKEVLCGF